MKRSWPLIAFGAVLLIGLCGGLVWYAVSGAGRQETAAAATTTSTPEMIEVTTTTGDLVPRSLDGVLVSPVDANLQAYAVMVENSIDARPLSGPANANLAFEFPVEGGITRDLLVFDATTTVDTIGPVRSARPYFVDIADGLNAVYAHVGGSPEALTQLASMSGMRDLNEFSNGKYFWRSAKRTAPHNAFTQTTLLHDADASKQWRTGHFRGWRYKDDDPLESTTSTVRGNDSGPTVPYGGGYTVTWSYDRENDRYVRHEGGVIQHDADGSVVTAKNVVLMVTDGQVVDSEGRLHIRTTGHGSATLYRDGKTLAGTWSRVAGEHIQFQGVDGTDMVFDRGTTWVEVTLNGGTAASLGTSTSSTTK